MEHNKSYRSYKDLASGMMSYSKRIMDCSKLKLQSRICTEMEIDMYSNGDWYFQIDHIDSKKVSTLDEWFL